MIVCGNCGRTQANHTFSEWYNCQRFISKFASSKKTFEELEEL